MVKKILTVVLLLGALNLQAQKNGAKPAPAPEPPKIDYTQIGSPMPKILLITMDTILKTVKLEGSRWSKLWHKKTSTYPTNKLTDEDFDNNANLFVMLFNPTCSHCIEETEMIKRNISLFNKSKLIMMANLKVKEYIPDFIKQRKTKDFPAIIVGLDSSNFTNQTFLYRNLPQINIYNKERKLVKIYMGDVSIDSLKQYIQ